MEVPEGEPWGPVLGLIPGDYKKKFDSLGNLGSYLEFWGSISRNLLNI